MPWKFQTDWVAVTLPDDWTDNSSADANSFINKATLEELTVGTWTIDVPMDLAKLATATNRMLEVRAKALVKISGGQVDILDASESTAQSPCVVRFTAFCKNAQAFCNAIVVGYPTYLVDITYYRYGCAEPTPVVAERAMDIVARIAVKER